MDKLLDYQYDGCYYLNSTFNSDNNNTTLSEFLENNFTKTNNIDNFSNEDTVFKKCKDEASLKQKDYFLVSNLDNNAGTLKYNCYIPKAESGCDFSNITQLVNPFNNTLKKLLGKTEETRENVSDNFFYELSNNDYNDITSSATEINKFKNAKCYKYNSTNGNMSFGKFDSNNLTNSTFVLYKTDLILDSKTESILNNPNINNMYDTFEEHNNNYETNFNKSNFNTKLTNIEFTFKNYLCDQNNKSLDNNKERSFDESLSVLGTHFNTMFTNLNDLSKDISNLYIITKYDLYRLNHLEEKIASKKKILSDLLGFDGASNGKLFDTKYLKNIKLSETIILSIIIIFLIYFYAKKK
tara:strand:- start:1490 stop:2551 length:1062 start_codon:yes stop_codon:yes gene_type:complete